MVVVFVLVSERTGVGVVKPESLSWMNKRRARVIGLGEGGRRAPTGFIRLQVSRLVSSEEREVPGNLPRVPRTRQGRAVRTRNRLWDSNKGNEQAQPGSEGRGEKKTQVVAINGCHSVSVMRCRDGREGGQVP
jgi:hypothetical protein